ncbi:MAG: alpha/beta fold hydrolase [Pirellula sp.]
MKEITTLLIVWLFVTTGLCSEPQDIAFTSKLDGTEQRYVELLPDQLDSTKPCDVVIALHGHGSDRWQFIRQTRGECQGVRDISAKHGLILISPDYRAPTSWMGPKAEADVVQIIADLKQRRRIDRVFLAGGSMGGTGALIFAALHPELIAGVCSLNGTANMLEYERFQEAIAESYGGTKVDLPDEYKKRSAELWSERFTMPLAVTTGGKDDIVPPHSVLSLVEKLKQSNRRVLSIHREQGGHATNYEDTCAAMEFMLRQANPATAELQEIKNGLVQLEAKIASLKDPDTDRLADVRVFHKGIEWALRYDNTLTPGDIALIKKALVRGAERAEAIESRKALWTSKKGKAVRGFVSAVDGSTQPYGVIVPQSYDASRPIRLDVVLHGSSKPVGMSELKFIARFDDEDANQDGPETNYIELHPLGRVENCYRWAGETDVFEAIEAVCRNYRIDRNRIVLRGMSMGASGTWHLGLKHPGRFAAIGPYCGYVDTHRFSETPIPNFIQVGQLPPHQELGLHMLDSVDYAANAGIVPAIAAIGENDVFFQAHVIMGEAFAKEGLSMVNLISPGTGHVIDPVTHREQLRRIGEHVARGLDDDPQNLRFVTWTLKYNRCHWLEILGLGKHYERAEFQANIADDNVLEVTKLQNMTRFAIHRPVSKVRIGAADIALPPHQPSDALAFSLSAQGWRCDGLRSQITLTGKRPGLQGPIDDAFATPFLCVRGTGQPWDAEVNDWAYASLRRFEYEWARYMRGNLPVKNDSEVTEADVRDKHLILFGDPGSNSWIARALPQLPVSWTRNEIRMGGQLRSSKDHAPAFICESPFVVNRYLVVNSGHTFHEKEFAAFNYLLFPRLGDWAVIKTQPGAALWHPTSPTFPTFPEEVIVAGYFDEAWRVPEASP